MAELERQLASAHRESQIRAAEATVEWAEGHHAADRATAAEQGLGVAKAHQAETEAGLRKSLADIEATLQKSLETLESERNALESERNDPESARKARSEADQEVLVLQGR